MDTYLLLILNILINILNKLLSNIEQRWEKLRTTVEAIMPLTRIIGSLFEHVVSGGDIVSGRLSNLCSVGLSQWMLAFGSWPRRWLPLPVPPPSTLPCHPLGCEEVQPHASALGMKPWPPYHFVPGNQKPKQHFSPLSCFCWVRERTVTPVTQNVWLFYVSTHRVPAQQESSESGE